MSDVTLDTTDSALIADVLQTLRRMTASGKPVFERVVGVQDAETFLRLDDGLHGAAAAVVCGTSQRRTGGDSSQAFVGRLALEVVVRVHVGADPNADCTAAWGELQRLINAARAALLVDRRRDGHAHYVMLDGKLIEGTSIEEAPRRIERRPNAAFVAMGLAVVCGYSIEAA